MHKLTLLYAEDNQESRENYAFVLKDYFYEVYTAKDGREALEMYHDKKPDVLLLDVSMPEIDGLEVAQIIRKENEKIPIIMLTAHSEVDKLLRAVSLKLEEYLLKPINNKLLKNTMLNIIHKLQSKDIIQLKEGLSWNKRNNHLLNEKQEIKLTLKENLLIELLTKTSGNYFMRDTIIYHVWPEEIPDASHDRKLTKLISRLNKKIMMETGSTLTLIENSYALGYRLTIEEA